MRFVDGPGGAVTEADQLLGDVMSTRGYPVSDFDQRAADISVHHPMVMENYRTAHEIAVRQTQGKADIEDLRLAMIHYRTLFEELVGRSELVSAKATPEQQPAHVQPSPAIIQRSNRRHRIIFNQSLDDCCLRLCVFH